MVSRDRWLVVGAIAVVVAAVSVLSVGLGADGPTFPTTEIRAASFRARVTAEGILAAVRATPLTAPINPQVPFVLAWLVEEGTRVEAGDVIARFDPSQLEKRLEDGLSDRRISGYRIASAETGRETSVGKLELDVEVAGEELELAREFRSTDSLLYSKNEITESRIDTELAGIRAEHATRSRKVEDRLSRAEIELLAIEQRKADIKIDQAEEGLAALEVQAPHPGIVMIERDWRGNPVRVGDTVWSGRPLASIPDLAEMQAEVYVLEADAGDLHPGQPATVWLESDPDTAHAASLRSVDPMAGRRNRQVPVQYFRTVLELEDTVPEVMKPGTRVHAEILIADYDHVITVPRQAICRLEGEPVVYRWQRPQFVPVQVELGPAAFGRVVVTSGLSDRDRIALGNPMIVGDANDVESATTGGPIVPGGRR